MSKLDCDYCEYQADGKRGLKVHKGRMHRNESAPQFVTSEECDRIRQFARQGHYCTAIAEHLIERDIDDSSVRRHAFGRCGHVGGEEPAVSTGKGHT